ncbi:MAG: primosomal protein N' [Candidatus Izemoplasmatales bacterium]|jgi:primosomal protein N' (replication factor Y)
MIARILVDIPVKAVDRLYDYFVPDILADVLEVGMRVIVPFGSRELMGYTLEIAISSDSGKELKPIIRILDIESYLTKELIELAKQISIDTTTILIKVLETMLPSAFKAVYTIKLQLINSEGLNEAIKAMFKLGNEIIFEDYMVEMIPEIKKAIKKNQIKQVYDIKSKSRPATERAVVLCDSGYLPKTDKHKLTCDYLKDCKGKSALVSETIKACDITESVLKTLEKKGAIRYFNQEKYRLAINTHDKFDKRVIFNDDQNRVFSEIMKNIDHDEIFLLHGVTGSGKTEIYLAAIEEILNRGKEVIFLVPEIALTPMMVNRFEARFKNQVAVLHSGLSIGEKYDEWRRIIRKEVSIVIGARSAIFAPFSNLGMIVIDECHETTYKQDDMPKYYAIDVAIQRAKYYKIPLLMGSATPNIETYARYKRGYIKLLELPQRANKCLMPKLVIVDMKSEFKKGNLSSISEQLRTEIDIRLKRQEQVILLLNRRGYSTFVICRECGHVISCPNCDISLAYHEIDHSLKCHYCGHKEDVKKTCPKCGSENLRYMGTGTQKIQSEIEMLFPSARIIRMDNDSTRVKNAHEMLLDAFSDHGDILLGTQMIAKGLDFPRVTLVGIIQADSNLFNADFRSPEKTFQLITQVSGRAGRGDNEGKVVVQTYNTNHYAIRFAVNNDYLGFYQYEMSIRKAAKYIPFYFLVDIKLSGNNVRDVFLRGKEIVNKLRISLSSDTIILGPVLPPVGRINNRYICQILIKYRNEPRLDDSLFDIYDQYNTNEIFVNIDKSPM